MIRSVIIFVILSILIVGCSTTMDPEGYYQVAPVDDPSMLPYRFTIERKQTSLGSSGSPMLKQYVPAELYGDGTSGMYSIGNNWRRADSLTAVLFYADTEEKEVLSQININTTRIASHFPYDFDGDGVIEVAVAYTTRDTLWLEIIDLHQRSICRFPLEVGQDRDGNGFWDGAGVFCGVSDFNNDGYVELLVNCVASYDLYPRKLMSVDWFNKEIRWEYNLSGVVNKFRTFIEPFGLSEELFIIMGVKSLGNEANAGDMDDQHSYLIVLDENGKLRWKKETGGVFSICEPVLIDYDNDGANEIFTTCRYETPETTEKAVIEHGGKIKIYDMQGNGLDSIDYGVGRIINSVRSLDFDSDSLMELSVSLSDASIIIYDQRLRPVRKAKFYTSARVWDCRDFLGNGNNQLLVASSDNKLWLLSKDFKTLAQFGEGEDLYYTKSSVYKARASQDGFDLIVAGNRGQVNYFVSLVKSPWNTVFFRYPLLAFLAALLPMSLVVALILFNWHRTRKQKRIISQQRDRLNNILEDLKAAQEKLIAIEKYYETQDALQACEKKYGELVNLLPQIVFEIDLEGNFTFANHYAFASTGYTQEDLEGGLNVAEVLVPEERERLKQNIDKILHEEHSEGHEYTTLRKDGSTFPALIYSAPIIHDNRPVGLRGIVLDITQRKQAEEGLRWSERELSIRNKIANVFLTVTDDKMYGEVLDVILEAMESKYGVFGYLAEDGSMVVPSMTRTIWDKCDVPDKDIMFPRDTWGDSIWSRSLKEKKTLFSNEISTKTPEGHIPILRNICMPIIHQGELIGLIHVANKETDYDEKDIHLLETIGGAIAPILNARLERDKQERKRKKAEEALRESETRYKTLVENLPQKIFLKDKDSIYVSCNQHYAHDLRIKPDEIAGKTDYDFHPKELAEKYRADDKRIVESGKIEDIEERYIQNGRDVWVHTVKTPIKDEKGNIVGVLGIFWDITKSKRIDAREKARLQLLNDLRTANNIDACLDCGCKAIYEAGLFKRAVLTLHNDKKEIINLGQVGLDERVVQAARNASAPDEELSKSMTQEKHRLSHSYFIPKEASLGLEETPRHISQTDYVERGDLSWKAGDELFVPIIGDNNRYEGWLSVDTPFDGERPTIEMVRFLEQIVDIVTQKVREIRTLEELHRKHRALLESEERFRKVSASAQDAILMMDNEGRVSFWNEAAERVFGYKAEEILGKSLHETLGAERFHDAYRKGFGQFKATGEGIVVGKTLELAAVRKDGTEFPIELSVSIFKLKGKWNAVGILRDISERKQAEQALRESEAKYRTLVNRLPAITYIAALDETSTTLYISPQVELLLGVTQEEYLRDPDIWFRQLHSDDRERVLREVAQSHATGEPFSLEYRLIHSNGKVRWFHDQAVIVYDIDERPLHLQGVMFDITELKQAEQALRSERDFVRSLLDTANSLVVCLDKDARITIFNDECEKVTGYTREEVIGKSWPKIFLPEDHHHHRIKDFSEWVRQHPQDMYEGPLRTKSGQIRTILWSNSALFFPDSDELTAIAVGQDITKRKEAERQLQVANQKRYDQVRGIAGGVSHEIFNALFPATSCLNKLSQRVDLNRADELTRNRKLIQVIENAVQRAIEMTEQVTEYSKLESDRKVEEVSLQTILQEILLANECRIEELKVKVKLELSGDFLLKCYRPHVYSLFNNLMVNALDALAESKQRNITISACEEGNRLKIEFSDSGAGIPPENIDKIFDAFFSTKPKTGTGLGLAISKKIIELYDGNIEVHSSLDKGTKFIILM